MTVFIVPLIDLGEEHPAAVIVWGKSTECGVIFDVVQVAETRHLVLHLVPEACLVEMPASGLRSTARVHVHEYSGYQDSNQTSQNRS